MRKCSFCGKKTITYSSLGSYALSKSYSFNFSNKIDNAHLRICNECNSYLRTAEDNLKKNLKAPIKKGDVIGSVKYTVEGIDYTQYLLANNDVKKSKVFINILIIIIIVTFIYLYLKSNKKKKRNMRLKKRMYR